MPDDGDGGGRAKTGREDEREGLQEQPFHGGARGDGGSGGVCSSSSGIKMKSWLSVCVSIGACVRVRCVCVGERYILFCEFHALAPFCLFIQSMLSMVSLAAVICKRQELLRCKRGWV